MRLKAFNFIVVSQAETTQHFQHSLSLLGSLLGKIYIPRVFHRESGKKKALMFSNPDCLAYRYNKEKNIIVF